MTSAVLVKSIVVLSTLGLTAAPTWQVDRDHTAVNFEARHFVTAVRGQFREFDIDLKYNEAQPEKSSVRAVIQVASVNTGNAKRDAHLRTADWFDASSFPNITFESTRVEVRSPTELRVHGKLRIRDVVRDVELPLRITGVQEIPAPMQEMLGGAQKILGFEATLQVDRRDFEVGSGSWAMTAVVGAPIKIDITVEAQLK